MVDAKPDETYIRIQGTWVYLYRAIELSLDQLISLRALGCMIHTFDPIWVG